GLPTAARGWRAFFRWTTWQGPEGRGEGLAWYRKCGAAVPGNGRQARRGGGFAGNGLRPWQPCASLPAPPPGGRMPASADGAPPGRHYNAPMTAPGPDYPILQRIGWPWAGAPEDPAWQAMFEQHPQALPARVSEQHRTGYVLSDAPESGFRVESPPEWQRRPVFTPEGIPLHERAAVGDWVLHDGRRILALLPRRSAIKRAAAGEHYQQQVIAANVDTAFVVCGLDADFNPRRIER